MKKTEFRNLINECVREVLAEEKAKKKQLAKKKIEEIINEAELTSEDLNELFGLGGGKEDAELNKIFADDDKKIDVYLNFWGYKNKTTPEEIKAAKEDKKMMGIIKSSLSALGKLIGYENISTTKYGAKIKGKDGKEIQLTPAVLGDKGVESPGKVWQVKTKAGNRNIGSGAYGE